MKQKGKGDNSVYFGKDRILRHDESPFQFSLNGPKWPDDFTQEMKRDLLALLLREWIVKGGNFRWKVRHQVLLVILSGEH